MQRKLLKGESCQKKTNFEASVECVGKNSASRQPWLDSRAGQHHHCNQAIGITKAKSRADAELDFVVGCLHASVGKTMFCRGAIAKKLRLILRRSSLKPGIRQRCAHAIHLFSAYSIPFAPAFRASRRPSFSR